MSRSTTPAQHRRAQAHDQVRDDIVEAAWRLAERDGLAGVNLRELAAEVGMRAPSLYTYFSGKAAIYDAMFATGYAQLHEHLESTLGDGKGLERVEALRLGIERWLGFCQDSIPRYQLMFTRALPSWEPSPEAYAVSVRAYERMAEQLAELGIEGQRTLDLYTALASGLAAQQLANDPHGDRWFRLAPEAMEMFVRHLERGEPA